MLAIQRLALLCAMVVGSGLMSGCGNSRASTPAPPLPSPDGKLLLVTSINTSHSDPVTYGCVKFAIQDRQGKILYQQQTHAAARMRWSMHWQGNDTVVLQSSDIGTDTWQRDHKGRWQSGSR
ncbi:MAG: hypothetical protein JO316_26065 [Abitibacteriaceae bacterium]|nr:hypothetical protein [Abditibacteriaceae bacterium]